VKYQRECGERSFTRSSPVARLPTPHQQGGSALAPWPSGTGSFPIGGGNGATIGYVMGPSVDRAIGDRVLAANPSVPNRHLVYRVRDRANNIWNQAAHAGPQGTQAPIPPETSPFAAYTRIFGNLNTGQADQLKRRLAMRFSSLDLVRTELTALGPKLSAADRQRLEQHAESVREIERGLGSLESQLPARKPLALGTTFDAYSDDRYKEAGFLFFKVAAMALACDLTGGAVQLVLAGGAQGNFRMGRYLNLAGASKRSMSDVMVSCFQYMGFSDVNAFGYAPLASTGGGPLPNLT
jgi:hypothetical protein